VRHSSPDIGSLRIVLQNITAERDEYDRKPSQNAPFS
jgi:hypothetical protein